MVASKTIASDNADAKTSPCGQSSYAGIIRIRFQGSEDASVSAAKQHPFEIEPILTAERENVKSFAP